MLMEMLILISLYMIQPPLFTSLLKFQSSSPVFTDSQSTYSHCRPVATYKAGMAIAVLHHINRELELVNMQK